MMKDSKEVRIRGLGPALVIQASPTQRLLE
jgi:hypothetical protein